MKVTGIIAEYNPIHTGHFYQICNCKKAGADYLVAVMSGDFVQRGAPAIFNKFVRTKSALLSGIDLVLELPSLYATASAADFAQAAVTLLDSLGIVDSLSFGCETEKIENLKNIATFLFNPDELFQKDFQKYQAQGNSYPKARELALAQRLKTEDLNLLKSPNNILALEYFIALEKNHSSLTPMPLLRKGLPYHTATLDPTVFPSATALRKTILSYKENKNSIDSMQASLHPAVFQYFSENNFFHFGMSCDDFSYPLHMKLLSETIDSLVQYADISKDLSYKISHALPDFQNYTQFCNLLKTKNLTYTRISRCLLHILLNIKKEDWEKEAVKHPYARILGFRQSATPLLHQLKKNCSIPLITKLADAKNILSKDDCILLEHSIRHSDLYRCAAFHKTGCPILSEYQQPLIMIP